jgi:DNA repair protein RadC
MKQLLNLKENTGSINSPTDLFGKIKTISIDYSQENFLVFYLDTRKVLIDTEVVFLGGLNSCLICPKTLFRKALVKKSTSIIVAHNHPSGNLKPSEEDISIFDKLQEAGELIAVEVLDSIIFNENSYYAMSIE